jgi:hypothetical protein
MTRLKLLIWEANYFVQSPATKVFCGYFRIEELDEERLLGGNTVQIFVRHRRVERLHGAVALLWSLKLAYSA